MEIPCNVLTVVAIGYSLLLYIKKESLAADDSFAAIILILECLFVLVFARHGKVLSHHQGYRSVTDSDLMCVFLVPLCIMNEALTNSGDGDRDVHLGLAFTAVILLKYAFLLGTNKLLAFAICALCFSHLAVVDLEMAIVSSFSAIFLWKALDWIPQLTPCSFSFAEMSICLQLCLSFGWRILKELLKMERLDMDEMRLKWISGTAVLAIILATTVCWLVRAYRSIMSFVAVYATSAAFSIIFLTVVFKDNLVLWFWEMIQQDCGVILLLVSWVLLLAITVIWTTVRALQSSEIKEMLKECSHDSYTQQDVNTNRYQRLTKLRNLSQFEKDNVSDECYEIKPQSSSSPKQDSNVSLDTRKVFHLFVMLVYIPGLFIAPHILLMASCLAFGAFIIVEAGRVLQVPGVGPYLDKVLRTFVDERDQGPLFLTHFYLLIGMSLPLWLTCLQLQGVDSHIKLYSGVLSLGIGDTVACVAGRAFGRTRWKGTSKTVEGTVSSIFAQAVFIYVCVSFDLLSVQSPIGVLLGVVHGALYEAFTDQIDNLVLPLALYPFLCAS